MELALYDPEFGYYARAAQRSGPRGRFFYQRRRRPAVRRAARSPDRRDGGDPPGNRGARPHRRDHQLRARLEPGSCLRSRRGRRRKRPALGRHPARASRIAIPRCTARSPAPGRGERRAARAAQHDRRSAMSRDGSSIVQRPLPDVVRRRARRQRAARRAAGPQVVMREDGLREVYVDVA